MPTNSRNTRSKLLRLPKPQVSAASVMLMLLFSLSLADSIRQELMIDLRFICVQRPISRDR